MKMIDLHSEDSGYLETDIFHAPVNRFASHFVCDVLFAKDKVRRSRCSNRTQVIRWRVKMLDKEQNTDECMALFVNGEILYYALGNEVEAQRISSLLKASLY